MLNGSPGVPFMLDAGVRQGDPLSPDLFVLYIEPMMNFLRSRFSDRGISVDDSLEPVFFWRLMTASPGKFANDRIYVSIGQGGLERSTVKELIQAIHLKSLGDAITATGKYCDAPRWMTPAISLFLWLLFSKELGLTSSTRLLKANETIFRTLVLYATLMDRSPYVLWDYRLEGLLTNSAIQE